MCNLQQGAALHLSAMILASRSFSPNRPESPRAVSLEGPQAPTVGLCLPPAAPSATLNWIVALSVRHGSRRSRPPRRREHSTTQSNNTSAQKPSIYGAFETSALRRRKRTAADDAIHDRSRRRRRNHDQRLIDETRLTPISAARYRRQIASSASLCSRLPNPRRKPLP